MEAKSFIILTMNIDAHAAYLLERLEMKGFEAYLVGGCVRDLCRGQKPSDWDIATVATPRQVYEALSDIQVIGTGIKHGTLTAIIEKNAYEITTYRSEGAYLDFRRPSEVSFVTKIEDDLARRDFTINALAYHPKRGLVDPFGGRSDLEGGILRTVGKAKARFAEDALRIMRALRFASTFNLSIETKTVQALRAQRRSLEFIASERIRDELMKLLPGSNVLGVLLEFPDILAVPIPEIEPCIGFAQRSVYHCYDVWEHTAHAVARAKPETLVRLACLFHDLGKPSAFSMDDKGAGHFRGHGAKGAAIARERLGALRFDNKTIEMVSRIITWHSATLQVGRLRRWLDRLGVDGMLTFIEVMRADILAHSEAHTQERLDNLNEMQNALEDFLKHEPDFTRTSLVIDGSDIMALGVEQGPRVGILIRELLDGVLDGRLENERVTLLAEARALLARSRC